MRIRSLHISHGHNFFGHYGRAPDSFEAIALPQIRCCAERGIEGDRFFDRGNDYNGQPTFFFVGGVSCHVRRGGLRARVLSDGNSRVDVCEH